MDLSASEIWKQLSGWSVAELAAVIFAILYLVLAIRENIWCWFCAAVSTTLYIGLYFGARLYMESFLNVLVRLALRQQRRKLTAGGQMANPCALDCACIGCGMRTGKRLYAGNFHRRGLSLYRLCNDICRDLGNFPGR